MRKQLAVMTLSLMIIMSGYGYCSEETIDHLSPYFFVEEGDSNLDQFPLKSTEVTVNISGVIAHVEVRQEYANMGGQPISGRYIFPGSTSAAVHGMTMTIGDRVTHAKIKEKEEAKQIFNTAKQQGKNASLLEQKRPNVFQMEVANVMPGDTIIIELKYTELLVPQDTVYEFVYPTVVGPRYVSGAELKAAIPGQSWSKNPYLKAGSKPRTEFNISVRLNTGIDLAAVGCKTHDTEVDFEAPSVAQIRLANPVQFSGDRDFILNYQLAGKEINSGLIVQRGQKENYFLLMAQPPDRVESSIIPAREYIFVVDVSGSMHGFPLDTAKKLLENLIVNLDPTDSFNVMLFAGDSKMYAPQSVPATPAHLQQAARFISDSEGGGGTELLSAMKRALKLPRKEGVSRSLVIVTDGYVSAEREVFEAVSQNLHKTNVFAFGIGSSVNRYLIEGLAKSGQGDTFVVTKPEEALPVAQRFREYIQNPVLTDIEVGFENIQAYDVEPLAIPDLFGSRPVIVFGKWREAEDGTVVLTGTNGEGFFRQEIDWQGAVEREASEGLEYLWARARISRLSDFQSRDATNENREKIVELGLSYNLLTKFTSFVAVDEIIRNPSGQSQDVKQPLTLPKGVSNLAVGGGMNKVPEPGLITLVLLGTALLLIGWLQRKDERKKKAQWQGRK
ncbi:MAG: VWA domain-containing protein [Desulfobulbaceae bacterium]|nr:MAG: VWA domain-containing protein [Desulfobulbaceae bacterium]